ncbi:uncharacterized protein LOC124170418 [Ischnura elegans]|uniref:uncharacterized protein LOC124170418 n=1 Tax=Ischnura elegans TaxID=197161 RepID=UPI001ED86F42|nr:uncharacterized protein LOC124170418 [Ischnura elegans]
MNQCKSPLYSKTDNVVVHLGRLPEWISEQKTVKVLIKSKECVITSLLSSITWKEYRFMNSFCGKNLLPSQNQDLVNGQRLTHSTGGNVTVNFMAKLPDDINYCCKVIGSCINPFFGFDLCHHAIDLLNNEAFQCLRKVKENMDFVLSMAITEAQCSEVECKECSLLMDAPWLAASNPGGSLSIKEEWTGDDNLRSSTDSQDCLQSANEGTSQLPCAFQTTEIYIPVSDCQETRPDALFHVKEEKEDPLSEGMYPAMYTPDPPEISRDVADPLATDELPLTSTPFEEEWLESMAESTGAIVTDFDWKLVGAKEEPSQEEKDAAKCHVKEENGDHLMEESYPMLHIRNLAGNSTDVSDPLATDDMCVAGEGAVDDNFKSSPDTKDGVQDAVVGTAQVAYSVQPAEIFIPVPDIQLPTANMLPTSMENGELIQNQTMAMESMTEAVDHPTSERASALFTLLEQKTRASNSRKGRKVMDEDIESCGTLVADKITSCSIPGDGQFHSKSRHVSKIRGNRETMTVAGQTNGCDNRDTIEFFRVTDSRKSGHEAAMRENKEMSTSMIKNPRKLAKSKDNSYRCFNCGDAFNAKNDLIEHLKIHFGSGILDIDANLTIRKDLALKPLVSRGETNSSYQSTSSKSLNKLICKRQGMRQNGNGVFKANFGGTREKNVREVRKSFTADGASCRDSPHSAKKHYSCNECEQPFSNKSCHIRNNCIHAKEKPHSCGECEKSFSRKSHLIDHIRTHTKEKPYSCGECEKSFSLRSSLFMRGTLTYHPLLDHGPAVSLKCIHRL